MSSSSSSGSSIPQVLSSSVIQQWTAGLDASDVLECYLLSRQAVLHRLAGNLTITKNALGLRYRPPHAGIEVETSKNNNEDSKKRSKHALELTLEYGPMRAGTELQHESIPIVVNEDGSSNTNENDNDWNKRRFQKRQRVTWENEAKVYYSKHIHGDVWESANYVASLTGAVVYDLLQAALEYKHGRRYQPFRVLNEQGQLLLKSSSDTDFVEHLWKHLAAVDVVLSPVLVPVLGQVILHASSIRRIQAVAIGAGIGFDENMYNYGEGENVPAFDSMAETTVSQGVVAESYATLYQCIQAIAAANYSQYKTLSSASTTKELSNTTVSNETMSNNNTIREHDDDNGNHGRRVLSSWWQRLQHRLLQKSHEYPTAEKEKSPSNAVEHASTSSSSTPPSETNIEKQDHAKETKKSDDEKQQHTDDAAAAAAKGEGDKNNNAVKETPNKALEYGPEQQDVSAITRDPTATAPSAAPASSSKSSPEEQGGEDQQHDQQQEDSIPADDSSNTDNTPQTPTESEQAAAAAAAAAQEAAQQAEEAGNEQAATAAQHAADAAQQAAHITATQAAAMRQENLLGGDSSAVALAISECLSNPLFGLARTIKQEQQNLELNDEEQDQDSDMSNSNTTTMTTSSLYLYWDGSFYYHVTLIPPYISVVSAPAVLPQPPLPPPNTGQLLVDWVIAIFILVLFLFGLLLLVQQISGRNFRIIKPLYRFQRWFFHPRDHSYADLDDESEAEKCRQAGRGQEYTFGEDVIPLSMGGRQQGFIMSHWGWGKKQQRPAAPEQPLPRGMVSPNDRCLSPAIPSMTTTTTTPASLLPAMVAAPLDLLLGGRLSRSNSQGQLATIDHQPPNGIHTTTPAIPSMDSFGDMEMVPQQSQSPNDVSNSSYSSLQQFEESALSALSPTGSWTEGVQQQQQDLNNHQNLRQTLTPPLPPKVPRIRRAFSGSSAPGAETKTNSSTITPQQQQPRTLLVAAANNPFHLTDDDTPRSNRCFRDPDLVELPNLTSTTKVAVPVGVSVSSASSSHHRNASSSSVESYENNII